MSVVRRHDEEFDDVEIADTASGFASNTTLRDLEFQGRAGEMPT
jgi:hypothetical protein